LKRRKENLLAPSLSQKGSKKNDSRKQNGPPQEQKQQPGHEHAMKPRPAYKDNKYHPAGKLQRKSALITGGDSGIGRAVAVHYAMEGADVAIVYLNESPDAQETRSEIEKQGRKCLLIAGDVGNEQKSLY
jgi:hypothetical protein